MPLIALAPILGYAFLIHWRFGKLLSTSILFAISFVISAMYVFACAGALRAGASILFYGGCVILVVMLHCERQRLRSLRRSVPLVLFVGGSCLYWAVFRGAHYFFWDEFSHWGVFVREMIATGRLYGPGSNAHHLRYVPGTSLWQYFVTANAGYNEGNTLFAQFVLLIGATLGIYEKTSFKRPYWIVLILAAQILIVANFGHGVRSLFVDHITSAFFAGIIVCFLAEKLPIRDAWWFALPLAALTLTKDVGTFLALAAVAIMWSCAVARQWCQTGPFFAALRKQVTGSWLIPSLVVVPIVVVATWNLRLSWVNVPEARQSLTGLMRTFSEWDVQGDRREQILTQGRFLEVFLHQQISKSKVSQEYNEFSYHVMDEYQDKYRLSTLGVLILYVFLNLLTLAVTREHHLRVQSLVVSVALLVFAVVYLVLLGCSYLLVFPNGPSLPSYVRYVNTMIFPLILISFAFYMPVLRQIPPPCPTGPIPSMIQPAKAKSTKMQIWKGHRHFWALSIVVGLLYVFETPHLKPLYQPNAPQSFQVQLRPATDRLVELLPYPSSVFVVFPVRGSRFMGKIIRFHMTPISTVISDHDFLDKPDGQILETLADYDYVWFLPQGRRDKARMRSLLGRTEPSPYEVYRVSCESGALRFKPVM